MEKNVPIKPHSLAAWFAFMRPKTFWIAAIPVLVGSALSYAMLNKFNFWIFILTLAGAVGIQALSNMQNDYGYNKRKAERGNRTGLPRATTEGWISMRAGRMMIASVALICCLLIVPLIVIGGWQIFLIAVLSLLCAYFYMAGPLPISYTPFGEVLVLIFYGWLAVGGTFWLQTHTFDLMVLTTGTSVGLFGALVMFVNNFRDIEHDISVGRKTFPALIGISKGQWIYTISIFLPFVIIGWCVPLNEQYWPLLLILLALPRASFLPKEFKAAKGLQFNNVMFKTVKIEFLFGLLLTVSLIVVGYLQWNFTGLLEHLFANPFL